MPLMSEAAVRAWLHGRGQNTRAAYERDVGQLLEHAGKSLAALTLDDVQAWADHLEASGLAASTRARKLSAARSLLRFAAEQGHIERDVARPVKPPRARNDVATRILSEGEVTRMIYLADGVERVVIRLLYATGARVSELCGLRARDLTDRAEEGVQVSLWGKGEKSREVLVAGDAADDLRELTSGLTPDERVLKTESGPIDRKKAWEIVRAAAQRAGITKPVSPHWLRHAHASHALDRGAPVHLVKETLGHASLATTSRYAHARPSDSSSRYLAL